MMWIIGFDLILVIATRLLYFAAIILVAGIILAFLSGRG